MEEVTEEKTVRYRVESGIVSPRIGERYKKGEIFRGPPNRYTDFEVVCLDEVPDDDELSKDPAAVYKLEAAGGGWFNIVDAATGVAITDSAKREAEARKDLADLNGDA